MTIEYGFSFFNINKGEIHRREYTSVNFGKTGTGQFSTSVPNLPKKFNIDLFLIKTTGSIVLRITNALRKNNKQFNFNLKQTKWELL